MPDNLPREKLLEGAPRDLASEELLAVILGSGSKGKSVFSLSKELTTFLRENLNGSITVENLLSFKGIGKNQAMKIVAALELGSRFKTNKEKLKTYPAGRGHFVQGDCLESMQAIESDSVTLAFTSPPYHNAINYDDHVKKMRGEIKRWERNEVSYDFYKVFLVDRFKELYRIMRPGGHNIVNIAPVAWEGKRVALPFHFVSWMEELGWQFKEDIIWEKEVVRDKRSGVLMQHPYPGYYYPSLATEYIFVFQKPADKKQESNIYHNRTMREKKENKIDLKDYQAVSKNIWRIRPVAPRENPHPCPFPEELARRVVQFYSYKKDVVIDIFAGSGITGLVAEELGRKHIGLEIEKEYVRFATQKINNKAKGLFNGKGTSKNSS